MVAPPTAQLDRSRRYTVRLDTNCGPIVIELAVGQAPQTTAAFAHLVVSGYYNHLTFYRVVAETLIQGGDPNDDGTGGPNWAVVEPPPANLRYTKGTVGMAKSPGSPAGASRSQFFIVSGSNLELPDEYGLVGHVVGSDAALEAIAHVPTEASIKGEHTVPRVPIVIEKATLYVG
jgi:peptidyl-prolyl cis-trans isomerase B (cyclophilin B)